MVTNTKTFDERMTTQQAAQYTGYSVHTLRAWRKATSGRTGGPGYDKKRGKNGAVRYRKSVLDKWMKLQQVKPIDVNSY